jgi:hypothetical protein
MALPDTHHRPDRGHAQAKGHSHLHFHAHEPSAPHPAQAAPWSILRMTVLARLGAALAVSACLWTAVLFALR